MRYKLKDQGIVHFPMPEGIPKSDYLQNRKNPRRRPSNQAFDPEITRAQMEAEIEKQRQLLKDQPERLERLEKVAARVRTILKQTNRKAGK